MCWGVCPRLGAAVTPPPKQNWDGPKDPIWQQKKKKTWQHGEKTEKGAEGRVPPTLRLAPEVAKRFEGTDTEGPRARHPGHNLGLLPGSPRKVRRGWWGETPASPRH